LKKKPRPESARNVRRRAERYADKLMRERERLFLLTPGGSAERPLTVESASVVDTRARSLRCPRCDGEHELLEHKAVMVAGERLREALLRCRRCGSGRSLFFRLEERLLN
jgi:uncharacterized C2H2 Zn-finger protein